MVLAQELREIEKRAPDGITAGPIADNLFTWEATIQGEVRSWCTCSGALHQY